MVFELCMDEIEFVNKAVCHILCDKSKFLSKLRSMFSIGFEVVLIYLSKKSTTGEKGEDIVIVAQLIGLEFGRVVGVVGWRLLLFR